MERDKNSVNEFEKFTGQGIKQVPERAKGLGKLIFRMRSGETSLPSVSSVGGKALNLAILTNSQIQVPPWIVLTVEGCERLLAPILKDIDRLTEKVGRELPAAETARVLKSMIKDLSFDDAARAEILQAVRSLVKADGFVAVRSSAIDEDSKHNSFAGQLDSFLFQKPDESIFEAIKGVIASAFNERALVYRMSQGLSLKSVRTAVVIQEMVFGDVSGVAFTGNPINGNPEEFVIDALYGVGEGVVSGELDCDTWVIDSNGALIDEKIRDKQEMIVFDQEKGRGTKTVMVDEARRRARTLSEQELKRLTTVCRKIESEIHRGVPQDIEWCIRGDEIYVLQARPIAAFAKINKSERYIVFDNSDLVESYAGVPTPLTFSFAAASFKESFRGVFVRLWMPKWRLSELDSLLTNLLGLVHGRMYYNLLNWYRYLLETPIGGDPVREYDQLIGITPGNYPVFPDEERKARWPYSVLRALMGLRMRYKIATIKQVSRDFERNFYKYNGKYVNEFFRTHTNPEMMDIYRKVFEHGSPYWDGEIVNFIGAQRAFAELEKLLTELGIGKVSSVASVVNDLISGDGEIASMRPTREMMAIADLIRENDFWRERFLSGSINELERIVLESGDERFAPITKRISEFLEEYGCRCMNELKLEEPTLREDPSFVFTTIRAYVAKKPQPFERQLENQIALRKKAEELVFSRAGFFKRLEIKRVVARVRKHVYFREELRLVRGKYWGIIRRLFYAMGRNLEADGVIRNWKDIFMLKVDEIAELIEGRSPDVDHIQELIELRLKSRAKNLARPAVSRIYSYGDVCAEKFSYGTILESSSQGLIGGADEEPGRMSGIACGPGTATGRARVAFASEDTLDLDGEILVAERTDPGWIPLYPSISGLVIERGSVLSHSAVVAREMGIPTVVGIVHATQKIKSGDEITVDGSAGKVQINAKAGTQVDLRPTAEP